MHSEFARRAALVAFILLKYGEDKALFEFAHALGIENVALVHLQDECFQLIFHDSLSLLSNVSVLTAAGTSFISTGKPERL